ncbi:hypothetical protein [Enterobacter sp. PTB]|uniref:hypothetical protein n=1 Tax=Enterobacter sp. PTB TaxID=3143437 RepID=UPI003DAA20F7
MTYFWTLYYVATYFWLGYCHASAMRELGFVKSSPRYVGFLVTMLLWPVGVMMLPGYVRAVKSEDGEW